MYWWQLRQLGSTVAWKREKAARELGRSRDRRAVEPLLAFMRLNPHQEAVAAQALAAIGDPRAVEPLCEYLYCHPDASAVILALRELGDRRAIPALLFNLRSTIPSIREHAADALACLAWTPTNDVETALVAVAKQQWERCIGLGEAAVGSLSRALHNERGMVIPEVANALARIGGTEALNVLLETVFAGARSGGFAQPAVTEALLAHGPDVAALLMPCLRNEMQKVDAALSGLDCDAPIVLGYETRVRSAAARLFAGVGEPAMPALLELGRDPHKRVRLVAVQAMASIPDPRAAAALEHALADASGAVRVVAIKALKRRGWEPSDEHMRRLQETALRRSEEYEFLGLGDIGVAGS